MLKKEFKEKDVERLRNIVKGKHGSKTSVGIGYTKNEEFHKEGDTWEEDGRKWTIINGVKQNITKLDKAKESLLLPLFCPSCKKMMKHKFDKQFYIQYKHCYDCQLDFETSLKITGKWEEYEKNIINSDIDNVIKEFEIWFDEQLNQNNESFITETGEVENWFGSGKEKLLEEKEKTIKHLQSLKK
jgi:hypothetical protein